MLLLCLNSPEPTWAEQLWGLPQVTFHLNADNVLSVEAKDLNTGRHHLWKSGGGAIIAQGIDREKLQNGIVPYPAQNAIPVA